MQLQFRMMLAVLAAACLAACNLSELKHDPEAVFPDPAAYEFSDRVAALVEARDIDGVYEALHPNAHNTPGTRGTLKAVFKLLPEGGEFKTRRFYAELRQGTGQYQGVPIYLSIYDAEADGKFAQLMLAGHPQDGVCCVISNITVTPAERRPSTFNDFTLEGKGWLHYLVLSLLIGVPVLMIATAILCFVEKRVRYRWLWIPFILFGLWGFSFNWTTGAVAADLVRIGPQGVYFNFISLHLLGAGFATAGYFQPWILTIGSPVGAIVYLVRRRNRKPASGETAPYEVSAP